MKNLIKKSLYIGIGIAKLTKDKAKKYAKELEKNGVMGRKEAEALGKQLLKKSNEVQKKMSAEIDRKVKAKLKKKKK